MRVLAVGHYLFKKKQKKNPVLSGVIILSIMIDDIKLKHSTFILSIRASTRNHVNVLHISISSNSIYVTLKLHIFNLSCEQ